MQNDVRKPKHSAHKHRKGLTLERFATAKASGYNKQKKKDKQFALNAKKVNQYRKLQRKLQQSSTLPEAPPAVSHSHLQRLQARANSPAQLSDSEVSDSEPQGQMHAASVPQPQEEQEHQPAAEQRTEERGASYSKKRKRQGAKPETNLQRLARHVQSEKAAEEEAHQAAQRQAEEHRAKVARTEQQRKQQTSLLRKRTNSGQPVMRHRIEKLLDAIQR